MLEVKITGAPPYDGTYQVDMDVPFNGRELHVIKQVAGVRLGEIDEALQAGDYDVFVAFAAIALTRAGKVPKERTLEVAREVLMEAETGKLTIEDVPEEAAEDPPIPQPTALEPSADSNGSSEPSSGTSSGTGDDLPEITPALTGVRL